jgi:hypothetical protein
MISRMGEGVVRSNATSEATAPVIAGYGRIPSFAGRVSAISTGTASLVPRRIESIARDRRQVGRGAGIEDGGPGILGEAKVITTENPLAPGGPVLVVGKFGNGGVRRRGHRRSRRAHEGPCGRDVRADGRYGARGVAVVQDGNAE